MEKYESQTPKYFAAANGYNGFKSYFAEIFDPRRYDRIYVLKGGPGTGKSTFMKKIASSFCEKSAYVECIHCSSDPHSLDGVIIGRDEKKVAVIDGTAPHERDALLPGAFDEITDLAKAWDMRWLRAQKERISELNIQKVEAYKTAYRYLGLAGSATAPTTAFEKNLNRYNIRNIAIKIAAEIKTDAKVGEEQLRLTSAFGGRGSVRFDTIERMAKTLYKLPDSTASRILLGEIHSMLSNEKTELTVCKNPLDYTLTDAIYIPSNGIGLVCIENGNDIDLSQLSAPSNTEKETTRVARDIYTLALFEAERWFSIAADIHARLENIYSCAVNFSVIDEIYDSKFAEICEIMS